MTRYSPGIKSLVVVVTIGLAGVACSSSNVVEESVPCAWIIDEIDTLPERYVELAGAIAVPVHANGMQFGRSDSGYRFSKFGMAVRADVAATVSVSAASGSAYLSYDGRDASSPDLGDPMNFGACTPPLSTTSAWVIYAGGVWTTENGCVTLSAESAESAESVIFGVGTAC